MIMIEKHYKDSNPTIFEYPLKPTETKKFRELVSARLTEWAKCYERLDGESYWETVNDYLSLVVKNKDTYYHQDFLNIGGDPDEVDEYARQINEIVERLSEEKLELPRLNKDIFHGSIQENLKRFKMLYNQVTNHPNVDMTVDEADKETMFDFPITIMEYETIFEELDYLDIGRAEVKLEEGIYAKVTIRDLQDYLTTLKDYSVGEKLLNQDFLSFLFEGIHTLEEVFKVILENANAEDRYSNLIADWMYILDEYEYQHDRTNKNMLEINVKGIPEDPEDVPDDFLESEQGFQISEMVFEDGWHTLSEVIDCRNILDLYGSGRSGGYAVLEVSYCTDKEEYGYDIWTDYEKLDEYIAMLDDIEEWLPTIKEAIQFIQEEKDHFFQKGYAQAYQAIYDEDFRENYEQTAST